jgi:hypothetical protein
MTAATMSAGFDRQRWVKVADWLAVAVAVALPWSTTATAIFITGWLIVILATLNIGALRKELMTAAGVLPVLLWVLAAIGMLWADVSWAERLGGLANSIACLLYLCCSCSSGAPRTASGFCMDFLPR